MIPIHLHISGFLSYRDPVELNFESFDLACISGNNGAGKSSLLDSITWALFGEARGKSSDVINLSQDVTAAEVALTFSYENNIYRVQRTLPRNKSTALEFQVKNAEVWKPLTEKTTRDTQARIEQTLRLDYETFINASFFLQGKADQFTQKKASDRKSVLSTILGLEVWDVYKERTAEKRRSLEKEIDEIDGRTAEIEAELSEEDERKSRLAELEGTLKQLSAAREAQESALDNVKRNAALLAEQRKLAETLLASLERSRRSLSALEDKLKEKDSERAEYLGLLKRAKEIESAYKAWQTARKELEEWDQTAVQFREHEKDRAPLLEKITAEKARLEEEARSLSNEEAEVKNQQASIESLQGQIRQAQKSLDEVEARLKERIELEIKRNQAREKHAALKVENESLRHEMDQIKERIDTLKSADGADCPLCGQPLSKEHRKATLKQLEVGGREKGDQFRANKKEVEDIEKQVAESEAQVRQFANAENERIKYSNEVSQLAERVDSLQSLAKDWDKTGRKRLADVARLLQSGKYANETQKELAKLDKELAKLGYDASAHDAKRSEELDLRAIENEYHKLDSAKELSKRIENEINELEGEKKKRIEEIGEQESAHQKAAQVLAESEAGAPNMQESESKLFALREEENSIQREVGAAHQRVDVLAKQRARKTEFESRREILNQKIIQHKTLERAFGRDGVPALLIEQALPQIEQKANDLLDRLSDGGMSIRFVTQEAYKDKKRDDLKETLDIQISDSAGTRDYEMYSGGEAFRVNFAIRLALSEILAQRKGARLQTLVIDEGFGSQDALGRQRLIEAINIVKNDFAKILVITHLDELKDAFPNRVEVDKTERGSVVTVV